MTWIDYRKAYDGLSNSWFLKSLEEVGASEKWINFLQREMENWRAVIQGTELRFKRGIFQGDSLVPLLFIKSLIPVSKKLNKEGIAITLAKMVNE